MTILNPDSTVCASCGRRGSQQPQGTELWQVLAICPQSVEHQGEQAWYQSFKMPAGIDRDGALDFALAAKSDFPHEGSPCPYHGTTLMRWAIQKVVTYVAEQEDDI
jgi:hypothetical protein